MELEGVSLEKRSSYFFTKKHIEEFEIPRDEFQLSKKSPLAQQLQQFIHTDDQRRWRELLEKLTDLIGVIQW